MAWIELHQSVIRHRKTTRAAAALGIRREAMLGHLVQLWCWGLDNVDADGALNGISDEEIAAGAGWPERKAEALVQALVGAGWIDVDGTSGARALHDWYEYAGKLLLKREKNRERMRRARADHVQRKNGTRA